MTEKLILIIDDEQAIVDSFEEYLEDFGYQVVTAGNGREGLDVFAREHPDLVLVDLRMPELGGIQVLERISESSPLTPLIVVSGTGNIKDAAEALQKGAWDYLLKPVEDLSLVKHAIDKALEKARLQRENITYKQYLEDVVEERTAELEQINRRMHHIVETTTSLSFCTDVHQFASLLLSEFAQHMQVADGAIYVKETNGLRLLHALDNNQAVDAFLPFPLPEQSLLQQVMKRSEPLLHQQPAIKEEEGTNSDVTPELISTLVFPVKDEAGAIAAIVLLEKKQAPALNAQDKEIGAILASYSCEALRAVKAHEALVESETRLRQILDTLPVGIFIIDTETDTIKYTNPYAQAILGVSWDNLLEKPYGEVLQAKREVTGAGRSGQLAPLTLRVNNRDLMILKEVSLTTIEGRNASIECFIDISAQVKAEEEKASLRRQLLHADKMKALGTLAGGVAHDFNNILSAVIGYSDLGLLDLGNKPGPVHGKLEAIKEAAERARELVEQIRAFSRMQKQLQISMNIIPVVREVVKLLSSSLPATITIKTELNAVAPILGDPTQIHQVIMNLCTNAYHAMQERGGELTIRVAETEDEEKTPDSLFSELVPGRYVRLSISDTGVGILPEHKEKIFEPYFTTKEKSQGTGLGLAIVHRIVRQHGGAVAVSSSVSEGTTFSVYFPLTGSDIVEQPQQEERLLRGDAHILVVDDEETLVRISSEMLIHLGYTVSTAVGSVSALELFQQHPMRFDLVFSDFNMPDMTGVQLAEKIHRVRPDVPIVICTGYGDKVEVEQARGAGVRRILKKPLSMTKLALGVREVLDEQSQGEKQEYASRPIT